MKMPLSEDRGNWQKKKKADVTLPVLSPQLGSRRSYPRFSSRRTWWQRVL